MDVIAAIATGSAATAIGIVRVSGDGCFALCGRVFRAAGGRPFAAQEPRKMVFGEMLDRAGRVIDRGLAVRFPGPGSYTGEDCAEFHCHGSPVVLRELLSALFAAGARQAQAGEFTKRAFLNGRMDLTQAEAVIDLIDAETADAAANAAAQLDGGLRRVLEPVQEELLEVTSRFYAVVDYPDEDIQDVRPEEIAAALRSAAGRLERLLDTCRRGQVLKSGVRTAIVGRPNAGKSSLLNALAGYERAIVTDIPGTTRDTVEESVLCGGVLLRLIDTAGIRRKSKVLENVERYSVLRSYMAVDRADVCVILIDATEGFTEQDSKVAGYAHEQGKACIVAVNKWDAVTDKTDKTMKEFTDKLKIDFSFMSYAPFIFISALTGQRIPKLYEMIRDVAEKNAVRIPTGALNDLLATATARVQPPSDKGRRLKIYYITQASTKPPTFVAFVNRKELFHFSYQRYLENQIRETFGLDGTPVRFLVRERDRNDTD